MMIFRRLLTSLRCSEHSAVEMPVATGSVQPSSMFCSTLRNPYETNCPGQGPAAVAEERGESPQHSPQGWGDICSPLAPRSYADLTHDEVNDGREWQFFRAGAVGLNPPAGQSTRTMKMAWLEELEALRAPRAFNDPVQHPMGPPPIPHFSPCRS